MHLIVRISAVLALAAMALSAPNAHAAASPCKGLAQQGCESKGACSWVKAYKTTKGRDVSAFCRKKPERKPSEAKAKTPPAGVADASAR
ncbi:MULTISPECIES: hypothetical protein [Rhodomicrobium]|uniref:hypothetical protein n=1 Tax=Rhodomicrobium TaxID=1068 RepID=UPI000F73CC6E|nr:MULTISPECIES: hypothetical protein [Rhodomicrobium]